MRASVLLMVLPTVLLAGCGAGEPAPATGSAPATSAAPTASPAPTVYEVNATVIESPKHGPVLCNFVLDSLPPQCGGPSVPVVGWDWAAVNGEDNRGGTTWGEYHVTGTWDGDKLTLTEPAGAVKPRNVERADPFKTPCPVPPGGWQVLDPDTTTEDRQTSTIERARKDPGFAGAWVDQSINPDLTLNPKSQEEEGKANDPKKLILNIRTTGDVAALERELRKVWGGSLCVSAAERTHAELEAIQNELRRDGTMSHGINEVLNTVEADFLVADPAVQDRYDSRFGKGAVQVTSWLQPAAPK